MGDGRVCCGVGGGMVCCGVGVYCGMEDWREGCGVAVAWAGS